MVTLLTSANEITRKGQGRTSRKFSMGHFYSHGLTLNKYTHSKVWDEITYSFPNFNDATVDVLEILSNLIPHFTGHVLTYP